VKHSNGSPWNGLVNKYYLPSGDSTATFVGDFVKSGGSADALAHYATVAQAAANNYIRGSIVAFAYNPTDLSLKYRAAAAVTYCWVCDAPDVIFEGQEDSDSANLAATSVGMNADIVVGSGNTTTGASGMEIDSDSPSTTASAQLRILGLVNREDNALGTNARWLVLVNEHEFKTTSGVD